MARVILSLPIRRTADSVLYTNTAPRLEVFRTATYATAAGTSQNTVVVNQIGGFVSGATIRVGTNGERTITGASATSGTGTITFGGDAISFANNDAVVMTKTAAAVDAYATIYDDPDFATAITQTAQAFTADAQNMWTFFAKPGRYGVRYSNSANTTLRLDTEVTWDESAHVQVTPSHDSPTSGIQEALNKLSSSGGTVELGPGTFTLNTTRIIPPAGSRLVGSGQFSTIIKLADSATGFSNGMIDVAAVNGCEIANLQLDGNVANNGSLSNPSGIFGAGATNISIHDCYIKNQVNAGILFFSGSGQTNTSIAINNNLVENVGAQGIQVERCIGGVITGNVVKRTGKTGISVATGTNAVTDVSKNVIVSSNYVDKSSAPTDPITGTEIGFLLGFGWGCENLSIVNNVCYDNRAAAADGIGWAKRAGEADGININISGNSVYYAGAFGLDVGPNCTCVGNTVYRPQDQGIVLAFDNLGGGDQYDYGNVIVANNIIIDVDEQNQGGEINAIQINTTGAAGTSTIDNLTITDNIVQDVRGYTNYGLGLVCGATGTINNLIITGNNFKDASAGVKWTGVTATTVPSIRYRNNITNDSNSGEVVLVGGTKDVVNANWPNHAGWKFMFSRSTTGGTLGHLSYAYTGGTGTFTITSSSGTDTSTILWELIGTAA